jgi:hypothetical protein
MSHTQKLVPLALAGVLVGAGAAASSAVTARTTSIFFLRGEQLASVPREASSVADAVRKLVSGPSAAETRNGFRTYV